VTPQDLKEWRKRNGYTQVTLAEALNVIPITVSRWERGVREIPSFLWLALEALECRKAKEGKKDQGKLKKGKEV